MSETRHGRSVRRGFGSLAATLGLVALVSCGSAATLDRPATSTLVPPATAGSSSKTPATTWPKATSSSPTATDGGGLISASAPLTALDTITLDELPDEAIVTLELIASDGPYPYSKDGSVFQNRERLLPKQSRSYYREYTVDTPGSDDRGARRIIAGDAGERFYTADHYDSFKEIVP
jgi:ribonuclease T1